MTNPTDCVEIITSVQRRRRWAASEKVRMVEETFEPGMTVSLVARRHGVAPNQLFTWRRLVTQGSLTAAGSGEEVVPASDYRALQNRVVQAAAAFAIAQSAFNWITDNYGRLAEWTSSANRVASLLLALDQI